MVLEQLTGHPLAKKTNLDADLTLFTKFNSKLITDLYINHKTIKLLDGNIEEDLNELGYNNFLLDTTPKA